MRRWILCVLAQAGLLTGALAEAKEESVFQQILPYTGFLQDHHMQEVLCSGVFYSDEIFLTARHCLSHLDRERYRVYHPQSKAGFQISRIIPYDIDSLHYPNFDLVQLVLKREANAEKLKSRIPIGSPTNGEKLYAVTFGLKPECRPKCTAEAKNSELELVEQIDGQRVFHLLKLKTRDGPRMCQRDSGGGVFRMVGGRVELIALVTGRFFPYTDERIDCLDDVNLFTKLSSYENWLMDSSKERTLTVGPSFSSLEKACKSGSPDQSSWHDVQKLIIDVTIGLNEKEASQVFQDCSNLDEIFAQFLKSGKNLSFPPGVDLSKLPFLTQSKSISLSHVSQAQIDFLTNFKSLEKLDLNGFQDGVDLSRLSNMSRLQSLTIKHATNIKGINEVLRSSKSLLRIEVFNLRMSDPKERLDLCLFTQRKNWEHIRVRRSDYVQDSCRLEDLSGIDLH